MLFDQEITMENLSLNHEMQTEMCGTKLFFKNLLKRLGLEKFYPSKITLTDAISLRNEGHSKENLGFKIIHNLLSADCKAHLNELNFTEGEINEEEMEIYHPMDIMNVIYNCCDPILLQVLFNKMLLARLAIPFLIPNVMDGTFNVPLRSMQAIVPEWKINNKLMFGSLVDIEQPIISFMRISELKRSKSDFLNDLLSDGQPDSFFHRECIGGYAEKQLSQGTIELIYNLPCKDGHFKEFFTIFNLRGSFLDYEIQINLLIQISSVLVLFLNENDLTTNLYLKIVETAQKESVPIIVFLNFQNARSSLNCVNNSGLFFIEDCKNNRFLALHLLKKLLIKQIINFYKTAKYKKLTDIKYFHGATSLNVSLYSGDLDKKVDEINKMITSLSSIERKKMLLPLQSEFWPKIAKINKDLKVKRNAKNLDEIAADADEQTKQIRLNQLNHFFAKSTFIKKIFALMGTRNCFDFLNIFQFHLNMMSKACLPPLQNEYFSKFEEFYNCKEENLKKELQLEVRKLDENLVQASFGMEHVMREIGQVYESWYQNKNQFKDDHIAFLPKLVAKIMLAGFPFEIMDGDNAYVALQWVTDVLKCLRSEIGDKKLLVVSVIGVQSSGKSTMLNCMFGLQFSVSAGRCTKGVYCSLIPVDSQCNNLEYEYVLVIDTEGLRAPELSESNSKAHDNELATFVIGLGDITIINIKGENFSEMQDVLEIVVHALIRINKANPNMIKPQCVFVHQNVSGINVDDDLRSQQKQLRIRLDKITYLAAEKEKILTTNEFNDIISFDSKNCFYVPDLWQGKRPMVYVSEEYIAKVNKIKEVILSTNKKTKLSGFTSKFQDLWKALSKEDFVFSFRNSEELHAYSRLDEKMSAITWEIYVKCHDMMQEFLMTIKNSYENLKEKGTDLKSKCKISCLTIKDEFLQNLRKYFDESEDRSIIIMWQHRYETNLAMFVEQEKNKIEIAIDKALKCKQIELDNYSTIAYYHKQFLEKAKNTAMELRNEKNITEDGIKNSFEAVWSEFLSNLSAYEVPASEDWDWLKFIITSNLEPYFSSKIDLYNKLTEHTFDPTYSVQIIDMVCEDDIFTAFDVEDDSVNVIRKLGKWLKKISSGHSNDKSAFLLEANQICQASDLKIKENISKLAGTDFNEMDIHTSIFDEFNKLNDLDKKPFIYKSTFLEKFVLNHCRTYISMLMQMRTQYRNENNEKLKISRNKPMYFNLFHDTYHERAIEVTQVEIIYKLAIKWVKNFITENLPHLLAEETKINVPYLGTKRYLIEKVLKDLNNENNFPETMEFVINPKSLLTKRLNRIVYDFMCSESPEKSQIYFDHLLSKCINTKKRLVEKSFSDAFKESTNIHTILNIVKTKLQQELVISSLDIDIFNDNDDNGINNIESIFMNFMKNFFEDCNTTFNKQSSPNLGSTFNLINIIQEAKPENILADLLLGCNEQCPLCGNICDYTQANHPNDHKCFTHFPIGLHGSNWVHNHKLLIQNCTTCVDNNFRIRFKLIEGKTDGITFYPCRDYKNIFPNWDIPPDSSLDASLYWKRFMAINVEKLASYYHANQPDVPSAWFNVSKEDADNSLLVFS